VIQPVLLSPPCFELLLTRFGCQAPDDLPEADLADEVDLPDEDDLLGAEDDCLADEGDDLPEDGDDLPEDGGGVDGRADARALPRWCLAMVSSSPD